MDDKILEVKKEMMRIAKMKDLPRMERHELVKKRSERLSESERKLLIEECQRDYESYDRIGDSRNYAPPAPSASGTAKYSCTSVRGQACSPPCGNFP